jgi:hypothetical protein
MAQEFHTNDLALATVLHVEGRKMERLELQDGVAFWVFELSPQYRRIVDEYEAKTYRVEPKTYNQTLRHVRRELFTFLRLNGIKPAPSPRV